MERVHPPLPLALHIEADGYMPLDETLACEEMFYIERNVVLEPLPIVEVKAEAIPEPAVVALEGRRLVFQEEIAFALDSDVLDDASLRILDEVANLLRHTPSIGLLRLEGHADEQGNSRYNYALSLRRAVAARDYLVSQGIAADRLETMGSGEALPGADISLGARRRLGFLVLVWDDERP